MNQNLSSEIRFTELLELHSENLLESALAYIFFSEFLKTFDCVNLIATNWHNVCF